MFCNVQTDEVTLVQLTVDFYTIEAKPANLIRDRAYDSDQLDEQDLRGAEITDPDGLYPLRALSDQADLAARNAAGAQLESVYADAAQPAGAERPMTRTACAAVVVHLPPPYPQNAFDPACRTANPSKWAPDAHDKRQSGLEAELLHRSRDAASGTSRRIYAMTGYTLQVAVATSLMGQPLNNALISSQSSPANRQYERGR